ncbi:putative DNA-binding transcriptional regulator AlpA [Azospirillum fermentarium]|uniref:helix-turn-helix transcriptional regulator n=1 Tax=Azospirillum fermentarium TaxID=1233114 RepID=UPI002227F575|nr:helix-turn-helix domain-containing protein [Azospirillum fermentarium]MCW2244739.1 putative DNA-binding transcriptional regulator AlpA [Azospirillum fermentarium]
MTAEHSTADELTTISIDEFCRKVGITRRHLTNLRARGEGPPTIKLGRRTLIRAEAAAAWLRERERK